MIHDRSQGCYLRHTFLILYRGGCGRGVWAFDRVVGCDCCCCCLLLAVYLWFLLSACCLLCCVLCPVCLHIMVSFGVVGENMGDKEWLFAAAAATHCAWLWGIHYTNCLSRSYDVKKKRVVRHGRDPIYFTLTAARERAIKHQTSYHHNVVVAILGTQKGGGFTQKKRTRQAAVSTRFPRSTQLQ